MDNLTHGLLGLAIGALWRPDAAPGGRLSSTDRAALLASFVAAELPDLDYLWPVANDALQALRAHRGWSHSLVLAPVVAAVATGLAKAIWRDARLKSVYPASLAAVVLAHLLCDAWTGWGTRLFLPFSEARLSLDWTMVLDPWFTLPLAVASVVAVARRARWRRSVLAGLLVTAGYLGFRVASREVLEARVRAAYPAAARVDVFPALLSVHRWRYVAVLEDRYAAGTIALGGALDEQGQAPVDTAATIDPALRALPTVDEALAWARFPVVTVTDAEDRRVVRVADLRYHLGGQPTLAFVIRVDPAGKVVDALLDRGQTRELVKRWREEER
jgi:inner membrane protein